MRTFCLILLPSLVCAQVGVLLNSQNGISVSTAGYDAPYFIPGLPFSDRQTSLRTLPNGIHQTYPETRTAHPLEVAAKVLAKPKTPPPCSSGPAHVTYEA